LFNLLRPEFHFCSKPAFGHAIYTPDRYSDNNPYRLNQLATLKVPAGPAAT
jgi:hypothetical protein